MTGRDYPANSRWKVVISYLALQDIFKPFIAFSEQKSAIPHKYMQVAKEKFFNQLADDKMSAG